MMDIVEIVRKVREMIIDEIDLRLEHHNLIDTDRPHRPTLEEQETWRQEMLEEVREKKRHS